MPIKRKQTTTAAAPQTEGDNTAAPVIESEPQTSGDNTADQTSAPMEGGAAAPEGDKQDTAAPEDDTENLGWMRQWTVTIAPVPESKADKSGVPAIAVVIHREGKGQYKAAYGALIGSVHKEPEMAVRALMKMTSPKRTPLGEFTIDGLKEEPAKPTDEGSNAPKDPWTYEGEIKVKLDEAAAQAAAGSEKIRSGEVNIRLGSIETGKALNAAWSAMGATTEGGVNPPLDMWGRWLNVQTRAATATEPAGLLYGSAVSKNTASELGFMGSAPESIIALFPPHLNSAKSFSGWIGERVRFLARASVSVLYAAKDSAREPGNVEPLAAEPGELSDTLHNFIGSLRDRISEARETAKTEAARQNANNSPGFVPVDAESLLSPSTREDIEGVAIFEWLSADLPLKGAADFGVNFPKHKLGKAMTKAWGDKVKEAETSKVSPVTSDDEGDKDEETAAPARTFADYSDDEAAEHLANMLIGARSESEDRFTILEMVRAILEKRDETAESNEAAKTEAAETDATK